MQEIPDKVGWWTCPTCGVQMFDCVPRLERPDPESGCWIDRDHPTLKIGSEIVSDLHNWRGPRKLWEEFECGTDAEIDFSLGVTAMIQVERFRHVRRKARAWRHLVRRQQPE